MNRNATFLVSLLMAVVLFGVILVQPTYSQGTFGYTSTAGTYSEVFGGTVHASGTGISGYEGTTNIGFTFTYSGTAYTTVNVNGNGYVTLGNTGNSGNASPLSSPNAATAVIAGWATPLSGMAGAEVRSELSGNAGSRILTIQWKNATRAPAGSSNDMYNFQIKLYEGSNNALIVFGSMQVNGGVGAEIGTYSTTNGRMAFRSSYELGAWDMPRIATSSPYYSFAMQGYAPSGGLTYSILARTANDAGVVALINPTLYNPNVSQNVQVRIRNWGSNNLDSVIIDWKVNGVSRTAVKYYPQPALTPGSEMTINLGTASFAANSFNTIWASTLKPNGANDARISNDAIMVYTAPRVTGRLNIAANGNPGVFPNFRDCMRHLFISGIGGNVDVHIFNGTYNEQIIIPTFNNSTAGGRVTFMSAASNAPTLTWTPSNNPSYAYALAGSCRSIVTITQGGDANVNIRNLNFTLPNGQNSGGFIYGELRGGSVNVENNTFTGPNNFLTMTNPFIGVYMYDVSNVATMNVSGNTISNYPTGIELDGNGSSTIMASNNTITGASWGVYVSYGNITVNGNMISGQSGYPYFYGVSALYANGTISNNGIYGDISATAGTSTYGLQTLPESGDLIVTNNMISVGAASSIYGISNFYSESYYGGYDDGYDGGYFGGSGGSSTSTSKFYHNSVNTTGSAPSAATAAFYSSSDMLYYANSAVDLVNNIFQSVGTGTNGGYAIRLDDMNVNTTTRNPLRTSDFNSLHTSGVNIGYRAGLNIAKNVVGNPLTNWRAASGRDNNSTSALTVFYGSGDLHLLNISSALWGSGAIMSIVPKDIDGETRTKPYIGADEARPSIRFVQHPQSRYACLGESFNMISVAEVTIGATVTYQWFKDGVELTGQTGAILTFGGVGYPASGVYTCLVKATDGTNNVELMSDAATLIVVRTTSIIMHPASKPVASGSTVVLEVEAEAVGGPSNFTATYQWMKRYWSPTSIAYLDSVIVDNGRITGATSNRMTIRNVGQVDTMDQYVCVVTGYCGSATTKSARLFMPTIAASNSTPNVCLGGAILLECAAIPGAVPGASVNFQWIRNGALVSNSGNISGANTKVLSIGNATAADAGTYICVCQYGVDGDPIPSNPVDVMLSTPVSITTQPVGDTLCTGDALSISVATAGTNATYQWFKGTTAIPTAIANMYTVASSTTNDAGTYSVVVTNSCGGVTSQTVDVFVNEMPAITTQPTPAAVTEGQQIQFSVVATGTATLMYQWYKDGAEISGATTATFTIAAAVGSDTGMYTCVVTNDCGSDTSNAAAASVVVSVDGDIVMGGFSLGTSSPNPTADAVRFTYSTPSYQNVRIAVANVFGKEVATIVNEPVNAGSHNVEFSTQALNLAPGIYSYTISSNGFIATQQFVVVR